MVSTRPKQAVGTLFKNRVRTLSIRKWVLSLPPREGSAVVVGRLQHFFSVTVFFAPNASLAFSVLPACAAPPSPTCFAFLGGGFVLAVLLHPNASLESLARPTSPSFLVVGTDRVVTSFHPHFSLESSASTPAPWAWPARYSSSLTQTASSPLRLYAASPHAAGLAPPALVRWQRALGPICTQNAMLHLEKGSMQPLCTPLVWRRSPCSSATRPVGNMRSKCSDPPRAVTSCRPPSSSATRLAGDMHSKCSASPRKGFYAASPYVASLALAAFFVGNAPRGRYAAKISRYSEIWNRSFRVGSYAAPPYGGNLPSAAFFLKCQDTQTFRIECYAAPPYGGNLPPILSPGRTIQTLPSRLIEDWNFMNILNESGGERVEVSSGMQRDVRMRRKTFRRCPGYTFKVKRNTNRETGYNRLSAGTRAKHPVLACPRSRFPLHSPPPAAYPTLPTPFAESASSKTASRAQIEMVLRMRAFVDVDLFAGTTTQLSNVTAQLAAPHTELRSRGGCEAGGAGAQGGVDPGEDGELRRALAREREEGGFGVDGPNGFCTRRRMIGGARAIKGGASRTSILGSENRGGDSDIDMRRNWASEDSESMTMLSLISSAASPPRSRLGISRAYSPFRRSTSSRYSAVNGVSRASSRACPSTSAAPGPSSHLPHVAQGHLPRPARGVLVKSPSAPLLLVAVDIPSCARARAVLTSPGVPTSRKAPSPSYAASSEEKGRGWKDERTTPSGLSRLDEDDTGIAGTIPRGSVVGGGGRWGGCGGAGAVEGDVGNQAGGVGGGEAGAKGGGGGGRRLPRDDQKWKEQEKLDLENDVGSSTMKALYYMLREDYITIPAAQGRRRDESRAVFGKGDAIMSKTAPDVGLARRKEEKNGGTYMRTGSPMAVAKARNWVTRARNEDPRSANFQYSQWVVPQLGQRRRSAGASHLKPKWDKCSGKGRTEGGEKMKEKELTKAVSVACSEGEEPKMDEARALAPAVLAAAAAEVGSDAEFHPQGAQELGAGDSVTPKVLESRYPRPPRSSRRRRIGRRAHKVPDWRNGS
ncbi:hypothetical protein B0H16DRAFT_1805604 [Mycena metata]|uniref:Uncharacterized protein n=1 Tax=Mycena metata TaxID=1033252 RepID=A0AAD7H917_9AGAR|nr:hypothetical protein B0H16DRAFT_1805604 [Mycena metata]